MLFFLQYFSEYWNWVEIIMVFLSYVAIGLYTLRYILVEEVLDKFAYTRGNGYMRLQKVGLIDDYYT